MLPAAPPPAYAPRTRSDDPDEVTTWVAQRYAEHSRVVYGTGPYGYEAAILAGQAVKLGWFRTRLRQTIRARFPWSCVHIPLDRTLRHSYGRQHVEVPPGRLAFIPAGAETTGEFEGGLAFAMQVDDATLTEEARARCQYEGFAWPKAPMGLELSGLLSNGFGGALSELVQALGPDTSSSQRAHCERRVIAALADALTASSGTIRPTPLARRRLADLEAWIDAHLGETITIGQLCSVAGAGERSLQLAFQAHRGMSPMRFVCERRLAAAHRRIANAEAADEITSIATGLGFTHLGRFSIVYREVFGESPSRTLQRGRTKAAPRGDSSASR